MRATRGSAAPNEATIRALPPAAVTAGIVVGVLAVSTSAILVRVADAPALALAFWRCLLGALALAPFALRTARAMTWPTAGQWRRMVVAGCFLAAHFALWIASLSYTTVASSAVLVTMAPLFVGIGAGVFLGEPPSRRAWFGIGTAIVGAVVIGAGDLGGADLGGRALFGDALAFAGAAAVSGYLVIGRFLRRRVPVAVYAAGVYGSAAIVLLPVCLLAGASLGIGPAGYDPSTWAAIIGMVVGPQLLGHTVFNTLLSTVTATVVAVVTLAEPIGATVLAYLLLDELPTPLFWLGAPLVLVGVYVAATRPRRRGK